MCCISFDSYIKPQLLSESMFNSSVVYLLIPTSNHNCWANRCSTHQVVYLLIPTSNHNGCMLQFLAEPLYIFWFLHQTTTAERCDVQYVSCISFDSYIKPQPFFSRCSICYVVYLLIPTSNHNKRIAFQDSMLLYIFWFLHQTTTIRHYNQSNPCCISFDSYIKPQHRRYVPNTLESCISFDSYIKPQPEHKDCCMKAVVYLLIPTSNHNHGHKRK